MKILNKTVFPHAAIAGRLNHPAHSLTHIIKATFDLQPSGIARIAGEQILLSGDEFYPDDEEQTGSLFYESDFAYIKPKADVLLVGKCHTPNSSPQKACVSSFSLGKNIKRLAVFGNRYWNKILVNPSMTAPQPFTEMDLRYERAYGGRDHFDNPVGRGFCKEDVTIADNVLPVPNIQDPDDLITSPMQKKYPAGFGPLNRNWTLRHNKMGTYDKRYLKKRWPWFPDDMELSHFNAAPEDQQAAGYLSCGETLTFENLHRKHSKYQCQLPSLRVRCFVRTIDPQTKKRSFEEVSLNLDTLWVNMEAEKLVLVWRGWMPVLDDEFQELQHVFIMTESLEEKRANIEQCYDLFCKARDEEESKAGALKSKSVKEKAEAISSKKLKLSGGALAGVAAAGGEAAELLSENEGDTEQDDLKNIIEEKENRKGDVEQQMQAQIDAMFETTGLHFSELSLEEQAELNALKEKLTEQLVEGDSDKGLEAQIEENKAILTAELSKLDLDINNLPPISEKAKAEQLRLHNELGIDEANLTQMSSDMDNLWAVMAAVFPKIGVNPENLTPLIEHSKPQFDQLKEQIQPFFAADADAKKQTDEQKKQIAGDEEIKDIRERAAEKEKFCSEVFDGLDLSGIDFSDCDLSGASFVGTILTEAVFVNATLTNAIFRSAKLSNAKLSRASAQQADFTQAEMNHCIAEKADFTKALFTQTKLDQGCFSHSNFSHANMASCNLNHAALDNTILDNADFANASMSGAVFHNASIDNCSFQKIVASNSSWNNVKGKDCSFSQADLSGSEFLSINISYADFAKAKLSSCNFTGSQMQNCFLVEVIAQNINLSQCDLFKLRASQGSDFSGAKLSNVEAEASIWSDATLVDVDFSESNLQRTTFAKADLSNARLFNSDLKYSNLDGAKLNNADARYVNLMQGSLGKADLTQANFFGSNLYEVEFLDAILSQTVVESANVNNTKLES